MRRNLISSLSLALLTSCALASDAPDSEALNRQVREQLEGMWRGDITLMLQDQKKYLEPIMQMQGANMVIGQIMRMPFVFLADGQAALPSEIMRGVGVPVSTVTVVDQGNGWFSPAQSAPAGAPMDNTVSFRFVTEHALDMRVDQPGIAGAIFPLRRIYRDSDWAIGEWIGENGKLFEVGPDGSVALLPESSSPGLRFDLMTGNDREIAADEMVLHRNGWDAATLVRNGKRVDVRRGFRFEDVLSGSYIPDPASLKKAEFFKAMPPQMNPDGLMEIVEGMAEGGPQPLSTILSGERTILTIRGTTIVLVTEGALWVVRAEGDVIWIDHGGDPPLPLRRVVEAP